MYVYLEIKNVWGKDYMGDDLYKYPAFYTFMSRNKQSRKYLIGRSYKNDEFDWPFGLVILT